VNSPVERLETASSIALNLEELGPALHVGALVLFEGESDDETELDIERLQALVERLLAGIPHARQRARRVPLEPRWVWSDDARFNLLYHVRHTRLPRPGDERQLKRLVGRLMSERLDRSRPLWELWVIEGVEGARFAVLLKIHPGVVEGADVPALLDTLARIDHQDPLPEPPAWLPRPAPPRARLAADSAAYWIGKQQEALELTREALGHPLEALRSASHAGAALRELVAEAVREPTHTPLNPRRIGGHRRVDLVHLPLVRCERIAHALSSTVVDVALAALAGGLWLFLQGRGEKLEDLELQAQVSLPLEEGPGANEQTSLRITLPLGIADPVERVIEVARARLEAESGPQPAAFDLRQRLTTWMPASLQKAAYAAGRRGGVNLAVQFCVAPARLPTLLGAQAQTMTIFAPLRLDQGLSVAIMQGGESLCFGFNSDWDLFPDLHALVNAVEIAFVQLGAQADVPVPAPRAAAGEGRPA